jgi:hypothetical protein
MAVFILFVQEENVFESVMKNKSLWVSGLTVFFWLFAYGKSFSQKKDHNIRPAFDLKLFVNDSTFYQAHMDTTFYVIKDRIVQVFPGETVYIEADLLGDSLVNLKLVPEIVNKEKTITVMFSQESEGRKHKFMRLHIRNPFPQTITYSAQINLMKQKKWVRTSVEPVVPNIRANESWEDIITTIALYNFHLKRG